MTEEPESMPPLGPGNRALTPSRLARPTLFSPRDVKPASAAPGPAETRTAAQAKTLLIKATAALEAQDHPLAASHLRRYLQVYPDAVLIRMQLAELYYQLSRFSDAEEQFRSALGEVIDPALPLHCRLHGHSRLMELAQERTDTFNEELHRGIGLVLLAEHRQNQKPSGQMVNSAQLLGKARTALVKAGEVSPKDARPALYLTSVWHSMRQYANAKASLEKAQLLSHLSPLNAQEYMDLAWWALVLK
jgi:tetratricopeptide (TPR) repeat protein